MSKFLGRNTTESTCRSSGRRRTLLKKCSVCKRQKKLDNFYKRSYKSGNVGLKSICKGCYSISFRYGLSERELNKRMRDQRYKCQVCHRKLDKAKEPIAVDHCHKSEKIRAIIHSRCNTLLGMALDDTLILKRAIEYLEKHDQKNK